MKINIRKARENFSKIINIAAIKKERVILMSNNKPKAALVSLDDLQLLENRRNDKRKRLAQLEKINKLRESLLRKGVTSDSELTLKRMREEKVEQLSNSS